MSVTVHRLFPMLSTDDLQASLTFYAGLLGGEVIYRFPAEGEPQYVSLRIGESELGMGQYTEEPSLHGQPQRPAAGHRIELCLYVDDIDATVDRLRSTDVPVRMEPADQPWGERVAYVEDPDGNLLMLAQ